MLVTVIVNVHNGEDFISSALDSVFAQTHDNFNVLVIDNASNDKTREILRTFLKRDARLSVETLSQKIGLFEARNIAIRLVDGDLVAFLDADDTWEKTKLEVAVQAFLESKIDLFYSNFIRFDQELCLSKKAYSTVMPSGYVQRQLCEHYPVAFSSIVFRRSILRGSLAPFNSNLNLIGDYDFVIKIAGRGIFHYCPEPLVTIRHHRHNLSKQLIHERAEEIERWSVHPSTKEELDELTIRKSVLLLTLSTLHIRRRVRVSEILFLIGRSGLVTALNLIRVRLWLLTVQKISAECARGGTRK